MSRGNITLEEMQIILRMLDAGESPADVACVFERNEEAMMDSVNAFRLGVSRLAKEARRGAA